MSASQSQGTKSACLKGLKLLLGLCALYHFVVLIAGSFLTLFELTELQWRDWILEFRPGVNVLWLVVIGVIVSFGGGSNTGVFSKGPRAWRALGRDADRDATERQVNE